MREKRETVRVEEKRVMVRTQTSTSEEEDCPLLLSSTSPATLEGTIKTRNTRRVETETVQCSLSSSSASSYASAALTQPLPLVPYSSSSSQESSPTQPDANDIGIGR